MQPSFAGLHLLCSRSPHRSEQEYGTLVLSSNAPLSSLLIWRNSPESKTSPVFLIYKHQDRQRATTNIGSSSQYSLRWSSRNSSRTDLFSGECHSRSRRFRHPRGFEQLRSMHVMFVSISDKALFWIDNLFYLVLQRQHLCLRRNRCRHSVTIYLLAMDLRRVDA